jgi:thioredoxin-like negative regulator of GroEL
MVALIRKVTARHFRAGGMDVTADQLADQIIANMRAVPVAAQVTALVCDACGSDGI